jgi:hypothetical protein
VINGLPLSWQQDPKKATAPQSIPKATVAIVLGGSGTGGSTTIVKEATAVAAVMAAKKAKEAVVANEVVAVKKATEAVIEEAAVAKVAVVAKAAVVPVANIVAVTATAEEVMTKMVAEEVVVATVTTYTAAMARLDDCGGGGPDTVRKDAKGAPYMTLDLKAVGKRTATMIELVGTSPPPPSQALSRRPMVCHAFIAIFSFFLPALLHDLSDPCLHVVGRRTQMQHRRPRALEAVVLSAAVPPKTWWWMRPMAVATHLLSLTLQQV